MCAKNHREPKAAIPMSRLAEGPQKPARPTFTPQLFKLLGCETSLTTQETFAVVSQGPCQPRTFSQAELKLRRDAQKESKRHSMHTRPVTATCSWKGFTTSLGSSWLGLDTVAIRTLTFLTCTQSIRLLCSSEEGCRTFDSDFCAAVLLIALRIGFEMFEHVLLCFASKIGPFC